MSGKTEKAYLKILLTINDLRKKLKDLEEKKAKMEATLLDCKR